MAFRLGRLHFVTEEALGHDAADRTRVYRSMRKGRFYNAFDGFAPADGFRFELRHGAERALMGDQVSLRPGLTAAVRVPPVGETLVRLYADGRLVHEGPGAQALRGRRSARPGVYRVEVDSRVNLFPIATTRSDAVDLLESRVRGPVTAPGRQAWPSRGPGPRLVGSRPWWRRSAWAAWPSWPGVDLDLSPDEAHYWEWSRRLDLSYYSKGPLIAYLIAALTAGSWERRPWPSGSAPSSWPRRRRAAALYRLGREAFGEPEPGALAVVGSPADAAGLGRQPPH